MKLKTMKMWCGVFVAALLVQSAAMAGVAVSFIAADDPAQEAHFRLLEKRQDQRVVREQVPGFEPVAPQVHGTPDPTRTATDDLPRKGLDPHGGLKGRRKSRKDKLREAATPPQRHPGTAP